MNTFARHRQIITQFQLQQNTAHILWLSKGSTTVHTHCIFLVTWFSMTTVLLKMLGSLYICKLRKKELKIQMALISAQTWLSEVHLEIHVSAGYWYLSISRRVTVETSLPLSHNAITQNIKHGGEKNNDFNLYQPAFYSQCSCW